MQVQGAMWRLKKGCTVVEARVETRAVVVDSLPLTKALRVWRHTASRMVSFTEFSGLCCKDKVHKPRVERQQGVRVFTDPTEADPRLAWVLN